MPNRVVSVELRAQVAQYVAGLKQAAQATSDLADKAGSKLEKHSAEISRMGTGFAVAGAGMLLVAGKAVKTFADFDKAMSGVAATGQDAKASLGELRELAVRLGADTQYSAQEAAAGITNLLKAGVSAQDVIGGGLAGALNLAAAGEMAVADAAETTAITLAQFKMRGDQAAHVADLLAAGAGKASGEVSDMAQALSQVGLVANQTGLSVEETTGALAAFGQAGLIGSDAGTSLKTMLQRLTPQSAEAQKQFDKLGISAYDANGQFVGLANFAGQLQDKLGKLTPEARNAAMGVMFGSDAIRAANVLYDQGATGIQTWIDAVNDQGYASRQAAELTNNLSGDLERLGGSLDSVFIRSGSGANTVLRRLAQGAEAAVDAIGGLPEPLLSTMTLLTGAGGLASLGVGGLLKVASAAADARANFKALGISAKAAKIAVAGIGGALAVGTLALSVWADSQAKAADAARAYATTMVVVDGKVSRTSATIAEINRRLAEDKTDWLSGFLNIGPSIAEQAQKVGMSFDDMNGYLSGSTEGMQAYRDKVVQLRNENPRLSSELHTLTTALDYYRDRLSAGERAALDQAQANEASAASSGNLSEALRMQKAGAEGAAEAIQRTTEAIYGLQDANLSITSSEVAFEQAIDDSAAAVKKLLKATRDRRNLQDIDTQAGRDALTVLTGLAAKTNDYAKAQIKQGASEKDIAATMARGRKAFADRARDLGFSEQKISELIAKYLQVPDNVTTDVNEQGADGARTRVNNLFNAIKKLPKDKQTKVLSQFNNSGIKAAEAALNRINGKTATTWVVTKSRGTARGTQKGYDVADGGLFAGGLAGIVREFAAGGFGQPQVRPFQGAAGVRWGEEGSGPWEAFISGAPQKRARSIAIWREVGRRLGQDGLSAEEIVGAFADGGLTEPIHKGHTLSWWQDRLKTPLELTRLQIEIRDLKKDLAEKETYYTGKGKKRKKKKRDKLRDLDRTEAQQRLAEAEDELTLAREAAALDKSELGSIEQRVDAYKVAADKADQVRQLAGALARFDLGSALGGGGAWSRQTDINGNVYYTGSAGGSAASITSQARARADKLKGFAGKLGQLAKLGLAAAVLTDIANLGVDEGLRVADAYLADAGQIGELNAAYADIDRYSTLAGQTVEGATAGLTAAMPDAGKVLADAFLARVAQPGRVIEPSMVAGYAVSGANGPAVYTQSAQTITYSPTINYPQAVPTTVQQNQDLAFLSALGSL